MKKKGTKNYGCGRGMKFQRCIMIENVVHADVKIHDSELNMLHHIWKKIRKRIFQLQKLCPITFYFCFFQDGGKNLNETSEGKRGSKGTLIYNFE